MNDNDRIRKTLAELDIETDNLTDETSLRDDLDIDSTEQVELVVRLEKEFGLSLGPEAEGIETFGELCSYIADQKKSATKGDNNATS